jgi:tripartite-type tricarboxylate transporter receptor subunit TctC
MIFARRTFMRLTAAAIGFPAVLPSYAHTQTYPSRPITMIVPFPPGGPVDVIARIISEPMKASLGVPIIIENVSGANGSIGAGRVARAAPDGYTLCIGLLSTHVMNGALYSLPYDLPGSFEPVAPLVSTPVTLFARKTMPGRDLSELIAWLKANPDKANHAATTAGIQAFGALFQRETGTRFQAVPYRGEAPAAQDLVGGQMDLLFGSANVFSQLRAGTVKAYVVLAKRRAPLAPDIPTAEELGLPALALPAWYGMFAPKGTPKTIVGTLNQAVVDALTTGEARKRFADIGLELYPRDQQTPEALGEIVRRSADTWWPVIKAANIKAE